MATGNSTDVVSEDKCGFAKEMRSPTNSISQKAEEQSTHSKYDDRTIPTPFESEDTVLRKV